MTTYTAVAERSEGWWAVHVPEVAGARTQARRLEQIEPMAREVIALLLDTDEDSFALEVDVRLPQLLGVTHGRIAQVLNEETTPAA